MRALFARFAGLFAKERKDRETTAEMRFHLDMRIEDNRRAGMGEEEARRTALLECGGIEQAIEACRDRRSLPLVETVLRDLRHAARQLRRSPAFTLVAVLSLALGIGANTAIFTLVDRLLLRLLPVQDPEQLVMIWTSGPHLGSNQGSRGSSYPMYQDFQQRAAAFSYVFCRYATPVSITIDNQTERVIGELVSGNYFQALGSGPALGRVFTPEEDDRVYSGHPVVVLSHQYWVSRFGASPNVIGKKILVNNYPMIVVGVSAAGFTGLDPSRSPQIRVPIQMKPVLTPASDNLGNRRRQWTHIFARMKPGYTLESARASLQPLLASILRGEIEDPQLRDTPAATRERFLARKVVMESAASGYCDLRHSGEAVLIALMVMVGLVLLIACFNVASLLVARAAARQKEIAVRLALGASRWQLVRQLLVESLLLASAGAALGLLLAVAILRGLLGFIPDNGMHLMLRSEPDWRILAFNLGLAVFTAILFGLAPAWHGVSIAVLPALRENAGTARSAALRKCLVAAQVAFSFLLLAGAGLFLRTLANLKEVNAGYHRIDTLVTFQLNPAANGYSVERLAAFYNRLLENVRAMPGVEAAAFSWIPVLHDRECDWDVVVEGRPLREGDDRQAYVNGISPGYWRTIGTALLDGRDFNSRDDAAAPRAAIVNRAFAAYFFDGRNPIGRRMTFNDRPGAALDVEIVGLVEDAIYDGPRYGVRRMVFLPNVQLRQRTAVAFYVRAARDPAVLYSALRRKVQELDPAVPVYEMRTLEQQLDETLATERMTATLSTAFGVLALVLAAIGLYGVLALTVTRRTREIGLRMALGARRSTVVWMVLREALLLLIVGLALGVPCTLWLSRFAAAQLFGVEPSDANTLALAACVLSAVAAASGLLPARRATAIDPIQALRHE